MQLCGLTPETLRFSRSMQPGHRRSDPGTRRGARRSRDPALNPTYQPLAAWNFSYAYFTAGRFEDALRILERLPKDNDNFYSWVYCAASHAAVRAKLIALRAPLPRRS